MRICIVCSYHLEVTAPFIKRLQHIREVDFFVPVNKGDKNVFLFNFDATRYNRTGFLTQEETEKIFHGNETVADFSLNTRFFLYPNTGFFSPSLYTSFLELSLHIKKKKYDVIHVIGQFPLLLLIHIMNNNVHRVHTLHESVPHTGGFSWHEKLMLKMLAKLKIDLIFPSKVTMNRFVEFAKPNKSLCHKIYFGIVENFEKYIDNQITEKKNNILLFGFINKYKGVNYLAEAVGIINKAVPDIEVTIAGKWSLPELRDSLVNRQHFRIIDKSLSNEEMTLLIQESALVICPYTSASNSGVIMTAFVFNKPVIASNLEGLAEVITEGKNGMLVQPANAASLASAIIWLLQHESKRKEMQEFISQMKIDSDFSWERITQQTISVYNAGIQTTSVNKKLATASVFI